MSKSLSEAQVLHLSCHQEEVPFNERVARANSDERPKNWEIPPLYERDYGFSQMLLLSGVFRPAIGARVSGMQMKQIPTATGDQVFLCGEELRQDDETLLLAIVKLIQGKSLDIGKFLTITLKPRTFARDNLGWADGGVSTVKLLACIRRLKATHLFIRYATGGEATLSFVSDYSAPAGKDWTIFVAPRLAEMFAERTTYLNVERRRSLEEGLQTWLFGIVNALPWKHPISVAQLQTLACDQKPLKKFTNRLKASLQVLRTKEIVADFSVKRGIVTITRIDLARKKSAPRVQASPEAGDAGRDASRKIPELSRN